MPARRLEVRRCPWPGEDPLYVAYHDEEWGVPEHDHQALFEKLMLDGFQAGLAWITILRKRENFRAAFREFKPEIVARFGKRDVTRLMNDAGIVRNRAKIEGSIRSARAWLEIMESEPGGFDGFIWSFTDGSTAQNRWKRIEDLPSETPQSKAMSKELKARGFTFCGPTICYAFMQACGMVNDHLTSCFRHKEV